MSRPTLTRRQYDLGHSSMYQVEVKVQCPSCQEYIDCTVYGSDVEMAADGCLNGCHRYPGFDRDSMNADAFCKAEAERRDAAEDCD